MLATSHIGQLSFAVEFEAEKLNIISTYPLNT
jgi:hypothetical protein